MKSTLFATILFALLLPSNLQAQKKTKMDIEVFSSVLKTADWAKFKYMENLESAKTGDQRSLKAILEFSATVDGTEALQHATTCIELIGFATDDKFGAVVYTLKPKLKTVLLDRFVLAQGRTKKEALRKPIQEWAPQTWKALNGEKVTCTTCNTGGVLGMASPTESQAPGTQPKKKTTETGKQ